MAVLGGGGSLARLSHSTQTEIKVGDTVVVVACASEKHVGARGVVKRVNSAAAASGQFAYQVEILTEEKQLSTRKPPVRWWFSRLQLNPAPKGGIPEKSRGTAEDSQRAAKDPETTADNGLTATVQEDDVPMAAHLALAAERERAEEELALKQKLDALRQRASRSPRRLEEVSAERRTPSRRPQKAKPDPGPHSSAKGAPSVKGPQAGKGLRSVGTERSASPPRRVAGSAPFVLGRPTGPLEAGPARDECEPLPDVISTAECALLLRELGETAIDEEGVTQITLELDADGSGRIDLRAFLDWWQHHGMQRVFMRFDRDQSGSIDTSELVELLKSLGLQLTDSQLQAAKKLLDPDGDGTITWAEYVKWWERFDVQRIFEQYDTDGGGEINVHELQLLCADLGVHLSKREVREALKKLDKDGSSSLSFDEFFPWWCAISDLKSDSSLVVETKGGRWEDNLFLQVDKVNQLKERQRVHLIEVAHTLGLSVEVTEQLAKKLEKLELEGEEAAEHAAGKGLNTTEVQAAHELRAAFAGAKKGGGSRGVEAALMKSVGAAEGGRNSATPASAQEGARSSSGRRGTGSERTSGARGSIMSGCSAMVSAISGRASQVSMCRPSAHDRNRRGSQVAPEGLLKGGTDVGSAAVDAVTPLKGGTDLTVDVGSDAADAVTPLSLGEAGPSLSAG